MNPAIIQTVSKTLPKSTTSMTVSGVIEKNSDKNQVIIKTPSGSIPVNVDSSRFSNGDPVILTLQNGAFRLEKSGVKIDNIDIDKDTFLKNTASLVRLSDILEFVKQSVISGDSSLISESVKTALDVINDKAALSGIDKAHLGATVKAISMRLVQDSTLSKEAIDSLLKLRNALQTIITVKPESEVPSLGLTAVSSLKTGIHLIPINNLATILDINSDREQAKKLLDPFQDTAGNVAVRVSGDRQKKIITPINGVSLQREFQSIITGMKSSLLQSIPPDSLVSLLTQKGTIDLDTLTKLDNQLVNVSSRFSSERAGSRSAAAAVITSWLSMSMDNIDNTSQSVKFPPVLPQSLQKDIESLDTLLRQSVSPSHSKLSGTGITETLLTTEARPNALPQSFSKLGLDNESQQLRNNAVVASIKTELLKLLSDDTAMNPVQQQQKVSDSGLRTIVSSMNNLFQSLDSNKELTQNILQTGLLQFTILKEQLSAIIAPSPQLLKLTDEIDKILKQLVTFKGNSPDLVTQLKEKTGILLELLTTRLPGSANDTLLPKDRQPSEQPAPATVNQSNVETILKIRSTVESAINKLESLQLLARQTPLADGSQQQILALPMKIGNEWTELNIRFLKKESDQKKKKANGSSFSVQINLAPSNLGAVSVTMDYIVKKSLKISMDFEKDTTREFFQKNNTAIKKAIAELGLPLFSVDIKKSIDKSDAPDEKVLEQLIDVKV